MQRRNVREAGNDAVDRELAGNDPSPRPALDAVHLLSDAWVELDGSVAMQSGLNALPGLTFPAFVWFLYPFFALYLPGRVFTKPEELSRPL